EHNKKLHDYEKSAESLRLLYVALTRAKHHCHIITGPFKNYEKSSLGMLLHPPEEPILNIEDLNKFYIKLGSRPEKDLYDDLKAIQVELDGLFTLNKIEILPPQSKLEPVRKTQALRALDFNVPIDNQWRTGSYSQMLKPHEKVNYYIPQMDHDLSVQDRSILANQTIDTTSGEILLSQQRLPKGREIGNFFHKLLEEVDFSEFDPAWIEQKTLEFHYLYQADKVPDSQLIFEFLSQMTKTTLVSDFGQFTLDQIPKTQRINEMEFLFPVRPRLSDGHTDEVSKGLTSKRLGEVFIGNSNPLISKDYPAQLSNLAFRPLKGFLKGFIDLVFKKDGRWYIVDYKSNHLGERYHDYRLENLVLSMESEHYFLQYHLYTVALHRYLELTLHDYDFDRHFGGVFYLFLRGMSPSQANSEGIFYDLPPKNLIFALSELMGKGDCQ
ncbi:MAG: PD-(D/E)XK nuclease family protein, partial [Deltaproteobacteria bacterium]|nr:PD-(D/E)XK nuclease family protein [Deltaproteobacteria bacterium]